jgi:hypothetical protein
MAARKKTDVIQLSKIRMREVLRAKLARDAEKKGITLNAEIVDRLEDSYGKAARDAAIIDMLVRHDDVSSQLLRDIADQIAKHPDWSNSEGERKEMLQSIYFSAYGKEPINENASPHEPWENPTTPRKADK